jgi:hypothetical protein
VTVRFAVIPASTTADGDIWAGALKAELIVTVVFAQKVDRGVPGLLSET